MQITLDSNFVTTVSESKQTAHRNRITLAVVLSYGRYIHKIHPPFTLYMSPTTSRIIGMGMGMCAEPQIYCRFIFGQVILYPARILLTTNPIYER
ncbi:uncharacterized protein METZ01_LOCUS275821 [marine metagenome]|uniref:Uncharacterized protein n=1 Tax=marine metagenome TaxID=408172 RepID=A0A382KJ02_9ZZZZ